MNKLLRIVLFPIEIYIYYKIFEYIYKSMPLGNPVNDFKLSRIVERYLEEIS